MAHMFYTILVGIEQKATHLCSNTRRQVPIVILTSRCLKHLVIPRFSQLLYGTRQFQKYLQIRRVVSTSRFQDLKDWAKMSIPTWLSLICCDISRKGRASGKQP